MTAEIGILNRAGVALAADSAVTIGGDGSQKVYNSANKLFALSKFHPVGIMIFGGADFMGVPWETIIKTYREQLKDTKFDTLEKYGQDFFSFLISDSRFYNENTEHKLVWTIFHNELMEILNNEVNTLINEITKSGEPVSNSDVEKIIVNVLEERIELLNHNVIIIDDPQFAINFANKHFDTVKEILESVINFDLNKSVINLFLDYYSKLIQSEYFSHNYTGLVISGYGESEIFPSLYEYHIEGIFLGHLKYQKQAPILINSYSDETYSTAAMRPFAQREMVYSFMNGIEPSLQETIMKLINTTIKSYGDILIEKFSIDENFLDVKQGIEERLVETVHNELDKIQSKYYSEPIMDILDILPKEELAEMAEALVNLTSFKRRISMDTESVGGPIDVCVITKGDGLVWIKRKHYFDSNLNYNFFNNYIRGME
ncbi:hypothetical protein [Peribacillus asahii]|uniref:hypothetical protein n=1 Tax=Peribacillus asahii TaxID=228899 RepID=UPI002079F5CC|nr:hypothetical protein [Peribacillus asahii]USK61361.1 hypothetical protein LIT37_08600 [Peribacillus asahii]